MSSVDFIKTQKARILGIANDILNWHLKYVVLQAINFELFYVLRKT